MVKNGSVPHLHFVGLAAAKLFIYLSWGRGYLIFAIFFKELTKSAEESSVLVN